MLTFRDMKVLATAACLFLLNNAFAQPGETLIYHTIQTDPSGHIIPWYNPDPAIAYDHNLYAIWNFWDTMRRDYNSLPYTI